MKVKRKGSKGAWLHAPKARRYGLATPKSGWTSKTREFEPSKHKRLLLAIFTIAIIAFTTAWAVDPSNPLFHTQNSPCILDARAPGAPCNDPSTLLWQSIAPSANLGEFKTFDTATCSGACVKYASTCSGGGTASCIFMGSDQPSGQTQIALTNSTIGDLSVVSGKTLAFHMTWEATSATVNANVNFGYYLTRNSTVPTHAIGSSAAYDPYSDPSVVFLQRINCAHAGTCSMANGWPLQENEYLLNKVGSDSIKSEDGGCPSGSPYLCNQPSVPLGPTLPIDSVNYLNFTAATNPGTCGFSGSTLIGPGCSWNGLAPIGTVSNLYYFSSQTLPWFQFQSQQYYLGFYVMSGLNAAIDWNFNTGSNGNMDIFYYVPEPNIAPQIDTGGWFGPLIKALISIGVFALNAILTFLGFIVQAIRIGLNAVGQFAGWGNIGDNFITDLNNLGSLFAQAGNVLGWLVNGVSLFVQYIAIIGNGFSQWMGNVCCGSNSFFGPGVTFSGFIFTFFGYLVTFGPLPIVTFDFVFFLLMTGSDGLGGFASWWQWNKWMVFLFIQAGITLVEILVGGGGWLLSHIPTISSHLPPRFVESFSAQTGQGISSAPAFRGFQAVKGKFGGTEHGGSVGFGAIGNLAPDSLLLWMGGLFIFWQYLGSSISPLPSMLTGLTTGCAPRACINSGVSAITPLLGLWIMMFCFLFFDYIATSVGFGLVNSAVDDGGVKLGFSKSTRKLVGRFGKKAKRFVGEAMDAKGVKEMGKQMKAETRKEIHAVQITTSKAVARQGIGLKTGRVNAQQRFRQLIKRPKQGRQHP